MYISFRIFISIFLFFLLSFWSLLFLLFTFVSFSSSFCFSFFFPFVSTLFPAFIRQYPWALWSEDASLTPSSALSYLQIPNLDDKHLDQFRLRIEEKNKNENPRFDYKISLMFLFRIAALLRNKNFEECYQMHKKELKSFGISHNYFFI